jgi:putative SOS response-associated peptidase YedK
MPVILRQDDWADLLDGAPDDARLLCRPYPELLVRNQTSDPLAAGVWYWRRDIIATIKEETQAPAESGKEG